MTHVVTDNCSQCRYTDCVEICPVDCFHADDLRVYIDPEVCIDCGACVPECPVQAIVDEFDLADSDRHWLASNAREALRHPVIANRLPALGGAEARRRALGFAA